MRSVAAVLLLLTSMAHAIVIGPTVYEQDDLGDPVLLQDFTYSLSADCTAATITSTAMDGKNRPVEGARTYLKYIDFAAPLISQGSTDREGVRLHKLPGSPLLMRGMFVLVIEKEGFRSKEIHFDISGCYSNGTRQQAPKAGSAGNSSQAGNRTGQQANASRQPENRTGQNGSGAGVQQNEIRDGKPGTATPGLLERPLAGLALLGLLALGLALASIFVYNIITAKRQL